MDAGFEASGVFATAKHAAPFGAAGAVSELVLAALYFVRKRQEAEARNGCPSMEDWRILEEAVRVFEVEAIEYAVGTWAVLNRIPPVEKG
jgi:hypothetical protein